MEKPIKQRTIGVFGGVIYLYEDRIVFQPALRTKGRFEIGLDDIEGVTTEKLGALSSRLKIYGHGTALIDTEMKWNAGEDIKKFILNEVLPLKSKSKQSNNYDELEKLAGLKKRSIITQEEFEAKKKQLLGLDSQE